MDERVPKELLEAANLRIKQLEDEVERWKRIAGTETSDTARSCLMAWWGSTQEHIEAGADVETSIVASVKALEAALVEQAERESDNVV